LVDDFYSISTMTGMTITIDYNKFTRRDEDADDRHVRNRIATIMADFTESKKGNMEYFFIPELSKPNERLHWHGVIISPTRIKLQKRVKELNSQIGHVKIEMLRNVDKWRDYCLSIGQKDKQHIWKGMNTIKKGKIQ